MSREPRDEGESPAVVEEGPVGRASGSWALDRMPNEVADADFGLFRDRLQGHYYPARVRPLDGRGLLEDPRLSAVELEHITIGYVRFGTAVSIDAGDLLGYHVDVPLQGEVVSRCGHEETVASPRQAAVFSPRRHTYVPAWAKDAAQLLIKLNPRSVEYELEGLLRRPVVEPLQFRMAMPTVAGPGRAWVASLAGFVAFLNSGSEGGPAVRRHAELLERSLISGLLLAQPHSYSELLFEGAEYRVPSSAVDRVVDAITSFPERPYSLADLCRIGCASARALQTQFQERFEMSPMQYLRRERLMRARAELRQGQGTVSAVAYGWGFSNLGRFARAYQAQFGELPSETLENAVREGAAYRG